MVLSFAATGVCHLILGTYIFLSSNTSIDLQSVQWIPVVSFSLMLFVACCGALPIPFVILSEMLPDKVRTNFKQMNKFYLIYHENERRKNKWREIIELNFSILRRFEALVQRFVCVFHGDLHLLWPKVFHQL